MAYEFKRLGEVEVLNEVPENATVLAEVDGSIKRVPGGGLGGGAGNILTIVHENFADAISGVSSLLMSYSYTANMTLTEALTALRECKLTGGFVYKVAEEGAPAALAITHLIDSTSVFNTNCLVIIANSLDNNLYWTADGISTTQPS